MTLPSIAKLASKYGIIPKKKLGQNFIFDQTLCDKIVRESKCASGEVILEIGPGVGGLTRAILLILPSKLIVIERDNKCIPLLEEIQSYYPNLHIITGNALDFDLKDICPQNVRIVSNLPYNIGTELIIKWLKSSKDILSMTLMLQKEVVERIISKINTKSYGRLSVICQLICEVNKCFEVNAKAFYPPPKVQSAIVNLIPKKDFLSKELIEKVELITHFAFSGRRKIIKSSLSKVHPNIILILNKLNIDINLRAENISPIQYLEIAKHI